MRPRGARGPTAQRPGLMRSQIEELGGQVDTVAQLHCIGIDLKCNQMPRWLSFRLAKSCEPFSGFLCMPGAGAGMSRLETGEPMRGLAMLSAGNGRALTNPSLFGAGEVPVPAPSWPCRAALEESEGAASATKTRLLPTGRFCPPPPTDRRGRARGTSRRSATSRSAPWSTCRSRSGYHPCCQARPASAHHPAP